MVKAKIYFNEGQGTVAQGELRVSILNKWDMILADISYEEFQKKRGYKDVQLCNMVEFT